MNDEELELPTLYAETNNYLLLDLFRPRELHNLTRLKVRCVLNEGEDCPSIHVAQFDGIDVLIINIDGKNGERKSYKFVNYDKLVELSAYLMSETLRELGYE